MTVKKQDELAGLLWIILFAIACPFIIVYLFYQIGLTCYIWILEIINKRHSRTKPSNRMAAQWEDYKRKVNTKK